MRQELDDLLCQRYPTLFAERHLSPQQTAMCWGFACGDGWFALIDSFCMEVLSLYADEPSTPIVIKQVKSKFKTLCIYCTGNDPRVRAMSRLVRTLSECIDEDSGNLRPVDHACDIEEFRLSLTHIKSH
jgi:hypothetical protein